MLSRHASISLASSSVNDALNYIEGYWQQLERTNRKDTGTLIGLPYPYLVPSQGRNGFMFEEQYYWDSFFTSLGLVSSEHEGLVEGMLDNLLSLLDRFGIIPNASRMYMLSRSQPPLLTTFIFHVFDTFGKDAAWLKPRIMKAQQEYRQVWMSDVHPQWHRVYRGLSRYYDINVLHDLAEAESGWDMTPRFERKCLDFLPVDLNCLLYKYETDFARAARILKDGTAEKWEAAAAERARAITDTMWSTSRSFFFDYNYQKQDRGGVWSLAGFYPLWAGLASEAQAEKLVKQLPKFEKRGGLTTTLRPLIDMSMFGSLKTQWAYPNGWAPLHYLVIEGLERYGYHAEAERVARKWLATNLHWFERHGVFLEKYNVVDPSKRPLEGVYPSQEGFGWTNGVFVYLAERYA